MTDYFLDTSFLIPFFGMEINIKEIENDFERILTTKDCKFGFSDLSLIEIRYLIEKSIRKGSSEELRGEYSNGLKALIQNDQFQNFTITDVDTVELEMEFLTNYKFKDYFDRMIMATSYYRSKYLVTMDNQIKSTMKDFIRKKGFRTSSKFIKVINWQEMKENLNLI